MWRILLALMLASGAFADFADAGPPNIIHILADDVGYDDVGCYGAPKIKTPNIDRLAQQGVRLTSFYAPSIVCTPSRAALMTGCYAQRVGLPRVLFPNDNLGLGNTEITIADLLKKRGYATALIGKWHLGHLPPFLPPRHGFDLYFGTAYPNDHGPERTHSNGQTKPFPPIPLYRNETIVEQPATLETLPDRFTEEAIKFITDHQDQPFFLHFANIETHTPWFVPQRFHGHSTDGAYGDAVECLDESVGKLMDALDRLHLRDNTLVVFTSDNGPLVKNDAELEKIYGKFATVDTARPHMLTGGKSNPRREGGSRVPAIFRWPAGGVPAGASQAQLAAGFDLFTTFAAAADVPIPADRIIDGVNLLPLLRGQSDAPPHESFYYYQGFDLGAVRDTRWKLALSLRPGDPPELFDLEKDPGEKVNLAQTHPDEVKRLERIADQAREDLGDARLKVTGKNRRPPATAPGE